MVKPTVLGRAVRRRLGSVLAVLCLVTAVAPAQVAAADPGAGYHVVWTVTQPDGVPRTDGTIAVGDDLQLSYAATDGTAVTGCGIRLSSIGGGLMQTPATLVAGTCALTIRLPDFPDPVGRAATDPHSTALDLCVAASLEFADSQARGMIEADQTQPGGRICSDSDVVTWPEVLDIPIQPGGTPREFASDPRVLSWNPADWGTDMKPMEFGSGWHYQAPAWVETCTPELRGEWWTIIRPERQPECVPWDVRLPGILPSIMPWPVSEDRGDWVYQIDSEYTGNGNSEWALTISEMRTPIAPSDSVFESSLPAIFPVDLATTRFVTAGAPWRPVFQFSGGSVASCTLAVVFRQAAGEPAIEVQYETETTTDGQCAFDVPSMADGEFHQFSVTAGPSGGVTYMGAIEGIRAPEPPTIEVPTAGGGDTTEIGVAPGDGLGLGMELVVREDPGPSISSAAAPVRGVIVGSRPSVLCRDAVLSPTLKSGGGIPHLDATCALPPGQYLASARMIDAAGVVSTSSRRFTVRDPDVRPSITGRTPASGARGVARTVRPTATFDVPVSGVSAATVRLRDVATGRYVTGTVSYDAALHRAIFRPASLLQPGRSYRLYLTTGIKSAGGKPILAANWAFKVAAATRH